MEREREREKKQRQSQNTFSFSERFLLIMIGFFDLFLYTHTFSPFTLLFPSPSPLVCFLMLLYTEIQAHRRTHIRTPAIHISKNYLSLNWFQHLYNKRSRLGWLCHQACNLLYFIRGDFSWVWLTGSVFGRRFCDRTKTIHVISLSLTHKSNNNMNENERTKGRNDTYIIFGAINELWIAESRKNVLTSKIIGQIKHKQHRWMLECMDIMKIANRCSHEQT